MFGMRLKRYHLKLFLFLALVAILFSRAERSEQFSRGHDEELEL